MRIYRGFNYGYIIVAVSLCLVILHYGARVSFGVFFKPMLDDFNWTRALTSGSLTLSMLVQGSGAIIMGRLNDKLGPRNVMTICSILLGAGFLLMSWVHSPWQLYLFYGMIVGAGMGGAFVALLSTIARWFAKKRGLMAGVTISGIGLGTLVVSPAANRLISIYDWRIAYLILGGVILVSGAILSQFLRRDPAGLRTAPQGNSDQLANPISPNAQGLTFREAIRTKQLWIIVITFFSLGYVIMSMNTHLVPNITDTGIPSNTAANIFAVSGIMGAAGCILIGTIADKIGNRRACILCFLVTAVSMIWMTQIHEASLFYILAAIYGLGSIGVTPLESTITAELFGIKAHGAILGLVSAGFTVGGAVGPLLSGFWFDRNGNYQLSFLICAVAGALGLILLLALRPLNKYNEMAII